MEELLVEMLLLFLQTFGEFNTYGQTVVSRQRLEVNKRHGGVSRENQLVSYLMNADCYEQGQRLR